MSKQNEIAQIKESITKLTWERANETDPIEAQILTSMINDRLEKIEKIKNR